jgi:hypothetical protein
MSCLPDSRDRRLWLGKGDMDFTLGLNRGGQGVISPADRMLR